MSELPKIVSNTISSELQRKVLKLVRQFKGFVLEKAYSLLDEIEFHLEIISIQNQAFLGNEKVYRSLNDKSLLVAIGSFTFNGLKVCCANDVWCPSSQSFTEFKCNSNSDFPIEIERFSREAKSINLTRVINSL